MKDHTRATSAHAQAMEDRLVDWFAIAGAPESVLPRFDALASLGLDFIYLVSTSADAPRDVARTSLELTGKHVLPLLAAR
jgi:hypothetical protein